MKGLFKKRMGKKKHLKCCRLERTVMYKRKHEPKREIHREREMLTGRKREINED